MCELPLESVESVEELTLFAFDDVGVEKRLGSRDVVCLWLLGIG